MSNRADGAIGMVAQVGMVMDDRVDLSAKEQQQYQRSQMSSDSRP